MKWKKLYYSIDQEERASILSYEIKYDNINTTDKPLNKSYIIINDLNNRDVIVNTLMDLRSIDFIHNDMENYHYIDFTTGPIIILRLKLKHNASDKVIKVDIKNYTDRLDKRIKEIEINTNVCRMYMYVVIFVILYIYAVFIPK